jgi:hypothetical protein
MQDIHASGYIIGRLENWKDRSEPMTVNCSAMGGCAIQRFRLSWPTSQRVFDSGRDLQRGRQRRVCREYKGAAHPRAAWKLGLLDLELGQVLVLRRPAELRLEGLGQGE